MTVERKVLEWFGNGDVGISSRCLALTALGIKPKDTGYPRDPADLNRCLMLLATVPELRAHLYMLSVVSPEWAALVNRWSEIEQLFLREAGLDWSVARSAPLTYRFMRRIIDDARKEE